MSQMQGRPHIRDLEAKLKSSERQLDAVDKALAWHEVGSGRVCAIEQYKYYAVKGGFPGLEYEDIVRQLEAKLERYTPMSEDEAEAKALAAFEGRGILGEYDFFDGYFDALRDLGLIEEKSA